MKIIKAKIKKVEVQLSLNEISALKQVLNEVCHGFKVDDFEKKIGASKQEVKELLSCMGDLKKHIRPTNSIIDSPVKGKKEVIRNKCCLKSNLYNLSFYISNVQFSTVKLGSVITLSEINDNQIIARTDAMVVLIGELQNSLSLFKNKLNSFNPNLSDNSVSCSFFNDIVKISVSSAELCKSNSLDELSLTIEFIFKREKQINSSDEYTSFTSTTTSNNIFDFIASVENFLIVVRSNS